MKSFEVLQRQFTKHFATLPLNFQKQPLLTKNMFLKILLLYVLFPGKHLQLATLGLKVSAKKGLHRRCFVVNFTKHFITAILNNIYGTG